MNQAVQPPKHLSSEHAHAQLMEIASTSSKNEKLVLIEKYLKEPGMFQRLIILASDPFVTFGVKKLPKITEIGTREIDSTEINLLKQLMNRELTGNAAKEAIKASLGALYPDSRDLLTRVLTKNLKAGFTARSINKVFPGKIYVFEVQLSEKLADFADEIEITTDNPWWAEIKEDGVRGFCLTHQSDTGEFISREGKPLNASDELREEIQELSKYLLDKHQMQFVFDGELTSKKGVFNDVVGDVHRKSSQDNMILKLIDLLPSDKFETGVVDIAYTERRAFVEEVMAEVGAQFPRIQLIGRKPINSTDEAFKYAGELIEKGQEGIILKNPAGVWTNKRTADWLKVKDVNTIDLVVDRIEKGEAGKRFENIMGAAICKLTDPEGNENEVSIGGGWSQEEREHFIEHPEDIVGHLIEVEFHEWTKSTPSSLRHPRFKRKRTGDKPIEDGQG